MPPIRRTFILAAVALGALPAASQAATLTVSSGGAYTYTAGGNVANVLQVSSFGQVNFYEQAGDPIFVSGDAAGTCSNQGTTNVSCNQAPTNITLNMGSETIADTIQLSVSDPAIGTVNAGPGDDSINGLGTLNGDTGNDFIQANNSSGGTLNGGDGNDRLKSGDGAETMNGGPGSDTVDYSNSSNVTVTIDGNANDGQAGQNDNVGTTVENIIGTPGQDRLTGTSSGSNVANGIIGGGGDDVINGNDGNDVFLSDRGPDGADVYNGGTGTDTVSYEDRVDSLRVRLDGGANDGGGGESDNVQTDIETVIGGYGDDFLAGQGAVVDNKLVGGPGNDDLHGGSGNDQLGGKSGNDIIDGGIGNDDITGEEGNDDIDAGTGNDTVTGGDGFDRIDAGTGMDTVSGNNGADKLLIRDGAGDTASCGAGDDDVDADGAGDTVNADCEHVNTGATFAAAAAPLAPVAADAPVAAAPAPATAKSADSDTATVTVSCRLAGRAGAARRVSCKVRLPKAASRGLKARLSRHGHVYAVGRAKAASRRQTLSLRSVRKAKPGRYTLALRDAAGRRVLAVTVFVK